MMTYYNDGRIIDNYLRKRSPNRDDKPRPLAAEDYVMLHEFYKLYKDFNCLITELITIRQVFMFLDTIELRYLIGNLFVMIRSLLRQRDMTVAIKFTYIAFQPNEKELAEIKRCMTTSRTRIDYIRNTVVAGNLEFTPIKEYLEIQQRESFIADLYDRFGDIRSMAKTSEECPEAMERYVEHIVNTVRDAGRLDEYKSRIAEYIKRRDARLAKIQQEKDEQERTLLKKEMMAFRDAFNRSAYDLDGDRRIGIGVRAMKKIIDTHGRDIYLVLCCYIRQKRYIYRYLGEGDQLVIPLSKARVFKSKAEAEEAKEQMAVKYSNKMFDIVEMPRIDKKAS